MTDPNEEREDLVADAQEEAKTEREEREDYNQFRAHMSRD